MKLKEKTLLKKFENPSYYIRQKYNIPKPEKKTPQYIYNLQLKDYFTLNQAITYLNYRLSPEQVSKETGYNRFIDVMKCVRAYMSKWPAKLRKLKTPEQHYQLTFRHIIPNTRHIINDMMARGVPDNKIFRTKAWKNFSWLLNQPSYDDKKVGAGYNRLQRLIIADISGSTSNLENGLGTDDQGLGKVDRDELDIEINKVLDIFKVKVDEILQNGRLESLCANKPKNWLNDINDTLLQVGFSDLWDS